MATPSIAKLDEVVVNRIAAGEVIHRPASAIKELLENSLDAGSSAITVSLKSGGLKVLQIQDNGHGIKKEDMGIVCERFTTSKLRKYEDLKGIDTFGFRGEALASISHVAHVTITSMTRGAPCAYKASYSDGKLIPAVPGGPALPKMCAGVQGTTIHVEDLFYNVLTRKNAFRSHNEEYLKCLDVISKYAVHNAGVSFTVKKIGDSSPGLQTRVNASKQDNIGLIYGGQLSKELLQVSADDERYQYSCEALVSNANYNVKKCTMILFVNNRLVESTSLRRSIEAVYTEYLPKNSHPFLYISLKVAGNNVDVNVHPTKQEVHLLYEDEIITGITSAISAKLVGANASRTFYSQAVLPAMGVTSTRSTMGSGTSLAVTKTPEGAGIGIDEGTGKEGGNGGQDRDGQRTFKTPAADPSAGGATTTTSSNNNNNNDNSGSGSGSIRRKGPAIQAYKMVRTKDSQVGQMETYLTGRNTRSGTRGNRNTTTTTTTTNTTSGEGQYDTEESSEDEGDERPKKRTRTRRSSAAPRATTTTTTDPGTTSLRPDLAHEITHNIQHESKRKLMRGACPLTSVQSLLKSIDDDSDPVLESLFRGLTFVGVTDPAFALVQHETKLYLLHLPRLSRELMYQQVISFFGEFARISLATPLPIQDLLTAALQHPHAQWSPEDGEPGTLASAAAQVLITHHEMLSEYFKIDITADGMLKSLPVLVDNYVPSMEYLPLFLLRLATDTVWTSEAECFVSIARALAQFYAVPEGASIDDDDKARVTQGERSDTGTTTTNTAGASGSGEGQGDAYQPPALRYRLQHILVPALKACLMPRRELATDGTIVTIAALEKLYRVFERC